MTTFSSSDPFESSRTADNDRLDNNDIDTVNVSVVWLDPNLNFESMIKQKEIPFFITTNDFSFFKSSVECQTFIEKKQDRKIIFIVSGSAATSILPKIGHYQQIHAIFIFCMLREKYLGLKKIYGKIISVSNAFDVLYNHIWNEMNRFHSYWQPFILIDPERIYEDVRKQSNSVLLLDFFKYFAESLSPDEQLRESAIVALRQRYRDKQKQLKFIDEINENYRQQDSIRWYSKRNFFYQLLNEAIRAEDLDRLLLLRYFLIGLSSMLRKEMEAISSNYKKYSFNIYHGTRLSSETFSNIEKRQGQIIKMQGYFFATKCIDKAQTYLKENDPWSGSVNVLFEIQCNPTHSGPQFTFLDLSSFNDSYQENEILFDLNPSFTIKSVELKNSFYVIRLSTSDQLKMISQAFLYHIDPHMQDQSIPVLFGRFLCNIERYDESRKHFEYLLKNTADNCALVIFHIGRTFHSQAEWNSAQIYYNQALRSFQPDNEDRMKDRVRTLNAIGDTFFMQKDYKS